jgi:hypothetical protein
MITFQDSQFAVTSSGIWGKSSFAPGSELSRRIRSRLTLASEYRRRGALLFLSTQLHSLSWNFGYAICESRAQAMAILVVSWRESHAMFLLHIRNMVCLTISPAIQDK